MCLCLDFGLWLLDMHGRCPVCLAIGLSSNYQACEGLVRTVTLLGLSGKVNTEALAAAHASVVEVRLYVAVVWLVRHKQSFVSSFVSFTLLSYLGC